MAELDRAIANLKRMGVTITTTARADEDSIAGRIQAAAERGGIAEPCGNPRCRLQRAHSGPCLDSSADPKPEETQ